MTKREKLEVKRLFIVKLYALSIGIVCFILSVISLSLNVAANDTILEGFAIFLLSIYSVEKFKTLQCRKARELFGYSE